MNEYEKQGYDIIADIHGYREHLEGLLDCLGYTGSDRIHPEGRKVVFLGDFVDRGPDVRGVLKIVRRMVESGSALAIMGNHEYNALCFVTPDSRGGYLRPHTAANIHEHSATLDAFAGHEEEWRGHLDWFRTLPLYLDLGGVRVVHACWDHRLMAKIGVDGRFREEMLHGFGVPRTEIQKAADIILKGPEIPLPGDLTYTGADGNERKSVRVKWWLNEKAMNYSDVILQFPGEAPDQQVPEKYGSKICGYPAEWVPVIFGHYGYRKPAVPSSHNVACIDLGIVKGGPLCAYRWNGESQLDPKAYVIFPPDSNNDVSDL